MIESRSKVPLSVLNVEVMYFGCWVCYAEMILYERGYETIITLSCLLNDCTLNDAYEGLCFAHRRSIDDVVKKMQAERGTKAGA